MTFTVTIGTTGRMTFDLGADPDPRVMEAVIALCESMSPPYIVETGCLSAEQKEAMAQRIADLILRGGAS
jgi:hypothetical protein